VTTAPSLQFLGATGTVTGSKFLVRAGPSMILVDCGLFQGPRELRERNWEGLGFEPSAIDAIVLTHAHVDHSGYIPRLVAAGFEGPVYATPSTIELCRIVLPDCGHLHEEEAEHANRKGYSRHDPALPLYTERDAWNALDHLRAVRFCDQREIAPGVSITFTRAGHILGAASVRLTIGDASLGVSGDIGRRVHPILAPPDPPPAVDCLLVESTYGNRHHDDASASAELARVINTTIGRGGSVLVPAFSVDRTEVLLHQLAELSAAGQLPEGTPVYVDSPMALDALAVYRAAIGRGDVDVRRDVVLDRDPFAVPHLREVRDVEGSKALNRPAVPSIVISAAGMASGGRVVHHLAQFLPDPRDTVVLVGFQAEGTRGRQLIEGATELKMLGRYVRVRASVVNLPSFSAHADASELVDWLAAAPSAPDVLYVVHGEPAASSSLAAVVRSTLDWTVAIPRFGERVLIGH
jgi:metallo-beta-lactamase family protein